MTTHGHFIAMRVCEGTLLYQDGGGNETGGVDGGCGGGSGGDG